MTTSDAASDYALSIEPVWCTSSEHKTHAVLRGRIAAAFDAGRASAPVPTPEPERLTDPDDPRIRDGALLAFESGETDGTHFTMGKRVCDAKGATYTAEWHRDIIRSGSNQRVYLLAEAPEPEPIPVVLRRVLDEWDDREGDDRRSAQDVDVLLRNARAAGLDIVRVQP